MNAIGALLVVGTLLAPVTSVSAFAAAAMLTELRH